MSPDPAPAGRPLVLATKNHGKLREIRQVLRDLPVRVIGLDELADVPEPAETGLTFADNARDKARYYSRATGQWCLADDSGLEVDALDGAPGVHSARYAAERFGPADDRDTRDRANLDKLLEALDDVPDDDRTARFVCHLALADGERVLLEAHGTVEGAIARAPRGENGFGYDPVFLLPEASRTAAELPPERKNAISHRGRAVREFARRFAAMLRDAER